MGLIERHKTDADSHPQSAGGSPKIGLEVLNNRPSPTNLSSGASSNGGQGAFLDPQLLGKKKKDKTS